MFTLYSFVVSFSTATVSGSVWFHQLHVLSLTNIICTVTRRWV